MADIASAIIAGASLAATSETQISGAINTNRNATVEIVNHLENVPLKDPHTYTYSGFVHIPPMPVVRPSTREVLAFSKTSDTACGAVFVFSYQVGDGKRFAVMGSVPYDYCSYENWMALGIMDSGASTNDDLYNRMYYDGEFQSTRSKAADGKPVQIVGDGFKVSVTMSDGGRATLKVNIYPN